jgi:hypothetical protein
LKPDVLRLGCAGEQHEFRVGDTVIAEIEALRNRASGAVPLMTMSG